MKYMINTSKARKNQIRYKFGVPYPVPVNTGLEEMGLWSSPFVGTACHIMSPGYDYSSLDMAVPVHKEDGSA